MLPAAIFLSTKNSISGCRAEVYKASIGPAGSAGLGSLCLRLGSVCLLNVLWRPVVTTGSVDRTLPVIDADAYAGEFWEGLGNGVTGY